MDQWTGPQSALVTVYLPLSRVSTRVYLPLDDIITEILERNIRREECMMNWTCQTGNSREINQIDQHNLIDYLFVQSQFDNRKHAPSMLHNPLHRQTLIDTGEDFIPVFHMPLLAVEYLQHGQITHPQQSFSRCWNGALTRKNRAWN